MIKKLNSRIYYQECIEDGDRPLLGLIVGDKYSLIVDSGNSEKQIKNFLEEIKELNVSPIKYVAITHWHWDHIVGLEYIDAISIVNGLTHEKLCEVANFKWDNKSLKERIQNEQEIEFCYTHINKEYPNEEERNFKIQTGDIIFDEFLKVDLGGVIVDIEHVPSDHSKDSTIISIPSEKTVFLGDSLYLDMYHGDWSYTKGRLIPLLNELDCYEADFYIPSHGGIYTSEEFKKLKTELTMSCKACSDKTLIDEAIKEYVNLYKSTPNEIDIENMQAFINGNIKN